MTEPTATDALDRVLEHILDAIPTRGDRWNGARHAGLSVVLVVPGRPPVFRAYGLARPGVAATPSTPYRLASVSKQFTAACALRLVERGLLSLETTVADVWPNFGFRKRPATVRDLLCHEGALLKYEGRATTSGGRAYFVDADVVAMCRRTSPAGVPGRHYAYSNTGYAVLAEMVAARAGTSYADVVRREVFGSLGLQAASLNEAPGQPQSLLWALGNLGRDQSRTTRVLGDGGIVASAEDMARWLEVILVRSWLAPATWDAATEQQSRYSRYGFGFRIWDRGFGHTGTTLGFRTIDFVDAQRRFAFAVLSNSSRAPVDENKSALVDAVWADLGIKA